MRKDVRTIQKLNNNNMSVVREDEEEDFGEEVKPWYADGLWQAPRLSRGIDTEQQPEDAVETNWSELFFDLIFVSVISKMGKALRKGVTEDDVEDEEAMDLLSYCFYFVILYQVWHDAVSYNTRFGANDLSHKLTSASFMLTLIIASFHVTTNLTTEKAVGFFHAIVYVNLFLVVLHLRIMKAFWNFPEGDRPRNFGIFHSVQALLTAVIMWTASVPSFVSPSSRWLSFFLFFMVKNPPIIFFSLSAPVRLRIISWFFLPLTVEHLNERFGLITMIVLGEGVDCLTEEVGNNVTDPHFVLYVVAVFLTLFCLKLAYYDSVADISSIDDHPIRIHAVAGLFFQYGHYLIALALALYGSAIVMTTEKLFGEEESEEEQTVVAAQTEEDEDVGHRPFDIALAYYAGSSALLYFVLTYISMLKVERMPNDDKQRKLHIAIYAVEHVAGFICGIVLVLVAMQLSFLPQVSNLGLVIMILCFNVGMIVVDFGNKWCLAQSSSWGGALTYIWNPLPFIRGKLPNHPLSKHPANKYLYETSKVAGHVDESTPLVSP